MLFRSDKGDVKGITNAVIELLSNSEKRLDFAINGRKKVEGEFVFNKRLKTIETYYELLAD